MTPERIAAVGRFAAEHQEALLRKLRNSVRVSHDDIHQDALQFAWTLLLQRDQITLDDRGVGWVFTVARHQALDLIKEQQKEPSLEITGGHVDPRSNDPAQIVADRHQLAELKRLPDRQHRALLQSGFGHSREEMAERSDDSLRTVDRQLSRARAAAREISREYGNDIPGRQPRTPVRDADGPDLELSL